MTAIISGNAPSLFPVEPLFGLLCCDDGSIFEIPIHYPLRGEWGRSLSDVFEEPKKITVPIRIDLVYLSIIEKKFYSIESFLYPQFEKVFENASNDVEDGTVPAIVVGMAPYGLVAVWIETSKKSWLVSILTATETSVPIGFFRSSDSILTLDDVCKNYLARYSEVKTYFFNHGLPAQNLYKEYMRQFVYRYQLFFSHGGDCDKEDSNDDLKPELNYIEDALFDGTFDKLHDGGLTNYHEAGKPKKLTVKWHIMKSEYTAHFWFDDEEILRVFERFYGVHPDTKTDFMIRIDAEKNKYELALYRYGLKEPQVINESAYQLIVFKNKFEYYRSENYNQPRGAWIW